MSRRLFWLSDEAWSTSEPHLPHGKPGKPRVDDRTVMSGILHALKNRSLTRGRTCKIHCLDDDRGRPVAITLTPRNIADISIATPLLGAVPPPRRLLTDKA